MSMCYYDNEDQCDCESDHMDDCECSTCCPPPRVKQWEVGVYELDRRCGGSEEGGWWYNTGTRRALSRRVFNSLDAAGAYARRLNQRFNTREKRLRINLYSMGYRGGAYQAEVYPRGEAPSHYPEQRPYYE